MKISVLRKLMTRLDHLEKEKNNYEWSLFRASSEDYKEVLLKEIRELQEEIDFILDAEI